MKSEIIVVWFYAQNKETLISHHVPEHDFYKKNLYYFSIARVSTGHAPFLSLNRQC